MKNKIELILSVCLIWMIVVALMFMSFEFVKIFFLWDSSFSWSIKIGLVLGWILFPAITLSLLKILGSIVIYPEGGRVQTLIPWKIARSLSQK